MIGFAVRCTMYDGEGNETHRTALLTLDTDAVESLDKPVIDVRMAGDGEIAFNVDPDDLWEAVNELSTQHNQWKRTRTADTCEA